MKKRILIVDDSSNLRKVIERYIESGTYEVELEIFHAQDGAEAEVKLQEQHFLDEPIDVVFLDWMMPNVTGYEFMKKIRSVSIFKDSPKILMLTAETNSEQIQACLDFHVSKYIIKPFTAEMIVESLTECLSGKIDGGIRRRGLRARGCRPSAGCRRTSRGRRARRR